MTSAGIGWFAIPTRGRPALLARALESYVANFAAAGRSVDILVADDSADPADEEENVSILRALARNATGSVWYAGPREKQACVERLAASGQIPSEVARFALTGMPDRLPSYGANRNAILLCTLGERVLCADDDTVCRLGTICSDGEGGAVRQQAGNASPEELWFHPDRAAAIRAMQWKEQDLIGGHEQLLGRPLSSLGGDGSPGQVGIVMTGLVGDCAMSSSLGVLATSSRATRARLVASEQSYRVGLSSREVVRQARSPTISRCPLLIMTSFSVDHGAPVPPFLPAGRNEDGVFGRMLLRVIPELHVGHLPLALMHDPVEPRSYDTRVLWMRASDCLLAAVDDWQEGGHTDRPARERLASLAAYFVELGTLAQRDFDDRVHSLLAAQSKLRLRWLVGLLDSQGHAPAFWADGIRRAILLLERTICDPRFSMPQDLVSSTSVEEAMPTLRMLIQQYGQLLTWWPAVIEAMQRVERPMRAIRLPA
jgi:hypothetical protein